MSRVRRYRAQGKLMTSPELAGVTLNPLKVGLMAVRRVNLLFLVYVGQRSLNRRPNALNSFLLTMALPQHVPTLGILDLLSPEEKSYRAADLRKNGDELLRVRL